MAKLYTSEVWLKKRYHIDKKTPEQIAASEKKFKDAMVLLKQKADEEQRAEDELKAKAKNA
jgi:predicted esterase YcpF (UPF0227 family)